MVFAADFDVYLYFVCINAASITFAPVALDPFI